MQVFIADYFFKSNLAEDFSYADMQVRTKILKLETDNLPEFNFVLCWVENIKFIFLISTLLLVSKYTVDSVSALLVYLLICAVCLFLYIWNFHLHIIRLGFHSPMSIFHKI